MARRTIRAVAVMAAAFAALTPAGASAATAPASAPQLTSAPYAFPVTLHWTPGADILNTSQTVYQAAGACTTPLAAGTAIATFPDNTTTDFTGTPADGTYCYYVRAADAATLTADSPGVTVSVDTLEPNATVAVSGQAAGGIVKGKVNVSGTSSDAVAGVAASVLRAGAAGACASGAVVGGAWDTTTVQNGIYDVCNIVTDNAGHVTIAKVTVTVANPLPPATPPPVVAPPPSIAGKVIVDGVAVDKTAPGAPTNLRIVLPRSKVATAKVRVQVRWVKPTAPDLDRVIVVLNLKRAPRGPGDGSRVYRGLGTSTHIRLHAGQKAWVALFAYDDSGNVSAPARRVIALAALIPLRPLSGSVVDAPPLLRWKAKKGSAYYNVQLFRNGRRVLVGWPAHSSYQIPANALAPGNYVWYVWPAVERNGSAPAFSDLIGRATFAYKP